MLELFYSIKGDLVDSMAAQIESVDAIFESENNQKIPEILRFNPPIISVAAYLKSSKCLHYLLENKADLSITDRSNQKMLPINFAIASNNADGFRLILSKGSKVNGCLHNCIKYDNIPIFTELISQKIVELNEEVDSQTPLEFAISVNKIPFVRILLDASVTFSPNLISNTKNPEIKDLLTAHIQQATDIELKHDNLLVLAVKANDEIEVLRILQTDKNLIDSTDDKGNTSFIYAALQNNLSMMQLLCEHGCDINAKNKGGRAALHEICYKGKLDAVKFIIENPKADLSIKTSNNRTALHCAAKCGNAELVTILLHTANLSPNDQDDDGDTPLHIAARYENSDAVKLMLDVDGVKFNIRNKGGRAAFDLSSRKFLLPFRPRMDEIIANARAVIKAKKDAKKEARKQKKMKKDEE